MWCGQVGGEARRRSELTFSADFGVAEVPSGRRRFAPAFTAVWIWRPLVVTVGLVTMVAGGLRALRQHDLKLILAYGTISQLGFMVVMFGLGTADTVVDACELVLAHALFKAALFMVVGIVDHQAGTRDIRRLPRPGTDARGTRASASPS